MTAADILRQLGIPYDLEKRSSTALVRMLRKGLLSPAATQRAAAAMKPGSFREVGYLGRGEMSLTSKVVGNVGNVKAHGGLLAHKIPTRQVSGPREEYRPAMKVTSALNARHRPTGGVQPLAPYAAVNSRGAFQHLASAKPVVSPDVSRRLRLELGDLHSGNVAGPTYPGQLAKAPQPQVSRVVSRQVHEELPHGQIFDFQHAKAPLSSLHLPHISPAGVPLGNLEPAQLQGGTSAAKALRRQLTLSNNNIRKYWATPVADRPALARQWDVPQSGKRTRNLADSMAATNTYRPAARPHRDISAGQVIGTGVFGTGAAAAGAHGYYGQQQQAAEADSRYLDMRQQQLAESRRVSGSY